MLVRRQVLRFGVLVAATVATTAFPKVARGSYSFRGEASAYGVETAWDGNTTADGTPFTLETVGDVVGIAHRTIPLGTTVAVEIPSQPDAWGHGLREHGALIWTKVIDRGPYVRGRVVDLTIGLLREAAFLNPAIERLRGPNSLESAALQWGVREVKIHVF